MSKKWLNNPKYGFKQTSRWYLKFSRGIFPNFNFSSFYYPKCRKFGRKMTKNADFGHFWAKNPFFLSVCWKWGKILRQILSKIHLNKICLRIFPHFQQTLRKNGFFAQKWQKSPFFLSFFAQIDDILGNKMTKNENLEKSPR